MGAKLYVGNLPFSMDEDNLRDLFSSSGTVEAVNIVMDSYNGRSKGFGFVEMGSDAEADSAIESLNGSEVGGRMIRVDRARPRENKKKPFPPRDNR
jgi:RNA recognition motif-containing protein